MDSTVLNEVDQTELLVSSPAPGFAGSVSTIGKFTVSHSGESIIFSPQTTQGESLNLTGLQNTDDVQILSLTGVTQSPSITLGFGDQTTAPVPMSPTPPLTSFLWTATLPSTGQFDVALAWGYYGTPPSGHACTQALIEVFDNGQLVGSLNLDQTNYPDDSVDIAEKNVGVFKSLGTFGFATKNFVVRLSGVQNTGSLLAGMLRLVPHGSKDPSTIGYIDPSINRAADSDGAVEGAAGYQTFGNWTLNFFFDPIASWHGVYYATPTGTQATSFPKLVDVQSALQALKNIPPGGVIVTAPTNQQFNVHFSGPLSGQACPTLVCSDSALTVTHDNTSGSAIGGNFPYLTVNGSRCPLKAMSYALGKPQLIYHLVQDAPAVQYLRFGEGLFSKAGYYSEEFGLGFSGRIGCPSQSGSVATWQFQGLPGGTTYQVAITWPSGDPNADVLQCLIQDGYGNTLATISGIDQSQPPNDFQDAGVGWKTLGQFTLPAQVNSLTVVAVGNPSPNKHLLIDTVRLSRVGAAQSTRIQPGDVVLFNAPVGFVTTSSGPMPSANGIRVDPAPASRLPTIPPGPKSLKLGINCDPPNYFGQDSCYANLAVQTNTPVGVARGPSGYPTRLNYDGRYNCGAALTQLTQAPYDAQGQGRGVLNTPDGVWLVQWEGSDWNHCEVVANMTSSTVVEDQSRRVVGPINRRYFQVSDSYYNSAGASIGFFSSNKNSDGSYGCDIKNVGVYPPGTDPQQKSRWRSGFLDKLKGFHCFRFMDFFATNPMNLSRFEHFPDPANFPLGYNGRTVNIPIQTIGPPTPDPFTDNGSGPVVRVTTQIPHGLDTGFQVMLRTTDGTSLGQVLSNQIDPRTKASTTTAYDPVDPTDGYNYQSHANQCHVIDATTLQIGINTYWGPAARMTNTLTPNNGVLVASIAPGAMMAPSDAANLCVEAGLEPWINVPWLSDDDCVTRLAQAFASQLPQGTMAHVEYGNEPWNAIFPSFSFSVHQNYLNGGTDYNFIPFYITRMSQVHKIFQDVWVKAGRNVNEVRRVCGVQLENIGGTTGVAVTYALAKGIAFDEIAPASYYGNGPASGQYDDLLTREQLLDLLAMNLQMSDMPGYLGAHLQVFSDALAQNPTQTWLKNVVLVNYEGGPGTVTTASLTANLANRNHGMHRDPDFCEIELYHLQQLEDAGVKLFNIFTLYGTRYDAQWGMYEGSQMLAGTGDALIDVSNRTDFENLPAIKSEMAAAVNKWVAMSAGPIIAKKPRNGNLQTYGIPAY